MPCNKKVQETMREVGVIATYKCGKEEYKDSMCRAHYNRYLQKLIPWGDRKNYVTATIIHFDSGRSMKYRFDHANKIYRYYRGVMQLHNKRNGWDNTNMPCDVNLFVVKQY